MNKIWNSNKNNLIEFLHSFIQVQIDQSYTILQCSPNQNIQPNTILNKIMFSNSYQNASHFEIWDSRINPQKNQLYKNLFRIYPSSNNKYFDKQVKSYIYSLQGQTAKICLPANDQKDLSLHQKYLVLHIYIPIGASWSLQLGITDINAIKRRINLTTVAGKQQIKYFSLRYPIENIQRGSWVFLALNVYSYMEAFKDQVFRSLDHITICSNCKIRRIFTMKEWNQLQIPKNYWFHPQIIQQFQLLEYQPQTLPKITPMNKHISNLSQPGQSLYEKLTPNKRQSKIALAKSEINHSNNFAKSKIYHNNYSPNKPVSLQPITRKPNSYINSNHNFSSKLRLNSMRDEFQYHGQQYLQNSNKISHFQDKKYKHSLISNQSQKIKGSGNIKKIAKKSPKIQKSFQQDQALNFQGSQQGMGIEQSSHQSTNQNNRKMVIKQRQKQQKQAHKITETNSVIFHKKQQERWSEDQEHSVTNQKIPIRISDNLIGNQRNSQNITKINQQRTIIKKQNKDIHIQKQIPPNNQIQLIYDEMVQCYYHPQTHTYYEIKQQ